MLNIIFHIILSQQTGDTMTPRLSIKSIALLESIRPFTTILGLAGAYIGAMVAGAPIISLPVILAMIVVFLVGAGSMPFND